MKRVAVVGAGAMGSVYGALLSRVADVVLLDVNREHVEAIRRDGLALELPEGGAEVFEVSAASEPFGLGTFDLVLVFVKSYSTAEVAPLLRDLLGEGGFAMSLQNGMGNAEIVASVVGDERVICGTTTFGATYLGPGRVRLAGRGRTRFGPWSKGLSPSSLGWVEDLMREAGLEPDVVEDPRVLLWEKLFVNAAINPLTALLAVENGMVASEEHLRAVARSLVAEAVAVARAEGYHFDEERAFEEVLEVARRTGKNRSSMLQDVLFGRRTEIGAINGQVVERGSRLGVPTPVNAAVVELIRFVEKGYGRICLDLR